MFFIKKTWPKQDEQVLELAICQRYFCPLIGTHVTCPYDHVAAKVAGPARLVAVQRREAAQFTLGDAKKNIDSTGGIE